MIAGINATAAAPGGSRFVDNDYATVSEESDFLHARAVRTGSCYGVSSRYRVGWKPRRVELLRPRLEAIRGIGAGIRRSECAPPARAVTAHQLNNHARILSEIAAADGGRGR